jgi:hypothetical protein
MLRLGFCRGRCKSEFYSKSIGEADQDLENELVLPILQDTPHLMLSLPTVRKGCRQSAIEFIT